jgi:hypothetical protein
MRGIPICPPKPIPAVMTADGADHAVVSLGGLGMYSRREDVRLLILILLDRKIKSQPEC